MSDDETVTGDVMPANRVVDLTGDDVLDVAPGAMKRKRASKFEVEETGSETETETDPLRDEMKWAREIHDLAKNHKTAMRAKLIDIATRRHAVYEEKGKNRKDIKIWRNDEFDREIAAGKNPGQDPLERRRRLFDAAAVKSDDLEKVVVAFEVGVAEEVLELESGLEKQEQALQRKIGDIMSARGSSALQRGRDALGEDHKFACFKCKSVIEWSPYLCVTDGCFKALCSGCYFGHKPVACPTCTVPLGTALTIDGDFVSKKSMQTQSKR
jgi:hypothetical protein